MIKKTYNDDLFVHMDWILKKKGKEPLTEEGIPHSFILNRWLSMVDSSIALIINATTNKWMVNRGVCSDKMLLGKFYKKIIPKFFKRYSYIKKSLKEKSQNEYEGIAKTTEMSVREIEFYEKTLAELKQEIK